MLLADEKLPLLDSISKWLCQIYTALLQFHSPTDVELYVEDVRLIELVL